MPCAATLATIAKENGIKSAVLSIATHTAIAYVFSLIYYTLATTFKTNNAVFATVSVCVAVAVAALALLLRPTKLKEKNTVKNG